MEQDVGVAVAWVERARAAVVIMDLGFMLVFCICCRCGKCGSASEEPGLFLDMDTRQS